MQPVRLHGEWEPHLKAWAAYPWDAKLWKQDLPGALKEWLSFVETLAKTEPICVLVPPAYVDDAQAVLPESVSLKLEPYGDIWIRDTGPLYTTPQPLCFEFNGWGGKFLMQEDIGLASRMEPRARKLGVILEGGSVDSNGAGVLVTSEECLLHPNRGSFKSRGAFESFAAKELGIHFVLWVKRGLINDHTDGHIDNLARFVSHDLLLIARPRVEGDPNEEVLKEIERDLKAQCSGLGIRLGFVPSAGEVLNEAHECMPASHLNFYLNEALCVVPLYGKVGEQEVLASFQTHLSQTVIGLSARSILTGGGAFHCMTNQEMKHP